MQIKALAIVLGASLASASAFPKRQTNGTASALQTIPIAAAETYGYGDVSSGVAAPSGVAPGTGIAAAGTGIAKPTIPLGTGNGYASANISTTFAATATSFDIATSTATIETTLLLVNGTSTVAVPTTVVVTKTRTKTVYYTKAPNGEQVPASTAAATTPIVTPSLMLSLSKTVTDKLLTFTQGTGTAQVVKTLTIKETRTLTLTITKDVTQAPVATPAAVTTDMGDSVNVAAATTGGETTTNEVESTVTKKVTRTSTITKTRSKASSSGESAATGAAAVGGAASSGASICAVAITSTITEQSTVYVTVPAAAAPTAAPMPTGYSNSTTPAFPVASNGTIADSGSSRNGTNGTTPALTGSTAAILSLATATDSPVATLFAGDKRYIQTAPESVPTMVSRKGRRAAMPKRS